MRLTWPALWLVLIVILEGCVSVVGQNDEADFEFMSDLSELKGLYKNGAYPSGYFSEIFFKNQKSLGFWDVDHQNIDLVDISTTDSSITITAVRGDCAVMHQTYMEGRDFIYSDGRIVLGEELQLFPVGPDFTFVGMKHRRIELGVDTQSHGKYRITDYQGTLAMLVVPFLKARHIDFRFERVDKNSREYVACTRSSFEQLGEANK